MNGSCATPSASSISSTIARSLTSASRGVGSNSPCARGGSRDSFHGGNARKLIDGHGRQAENGERDGCVRTVGDHFAFEILAAPPRVTPPVHYRTHPLRARPRPAQRRPH